MLFEPHQLRVLGVPMHASCREDIGHEEVGGGTAGAVAAELHHLVKGEAAELHISPLAACAQQSEPDGR